MSYLYVRVELESGKLQTDVYSKPTDTHQYLDFKSCHPAHVKKAIPYDQALRLKQVCNYVDEGKNFLREK